VVGVMDDRPPYGLGSWRTRRAFMFIVTAFCAGCITYVLAEGLESRVAETVVEMGFTTIGAIVLGYVFGAAWQDIAIVRSNNDYRARRRGGYRRATHGRVDIPEDEDGL
jgi:hypothetical protein